MKSAEEKRFGTTGALLISAIVKNDGIPHAELARKDKAAMRRLTKKGLVALDTDSATWLLTEKARVENERCGFFSTEDAAEPAAEFVPPATKEEAEAVGAKDWGPDALPTSRRVSPFTERVDAVEAATEDDGSTSIVINVDTDVEAESDDEADPFASFENEDEPESEDDEGVTEFGRQVLAEMAAVENEPIEVDEQVPAETIAVKVKAPRRRRVNKEEIGDSILGVLRSNGEAMSAKDIQLALTAAGTDASKGTIWRGITHICDVAGTATAHAPESGKRNGWTFSAKSAPALPAK